MKKALHDAKPFLKWVGGKGKVVPQLAQLFPDKWENYFEPFLGGGAVYFAVHHDKKAYLNDINDNLINAYIHIRDNVEEVIESLKAIEKEYLTLTEAERPDYYYAKRDLFNSTESGELKKTILLIFLNKTCFNGLYRENQKGKFNVPFGKYKSPKICHEENLRAVSYELQNTEVMNSSYRDAVQNARKGDFVYFDPPYHPLNSTSSFTSYHEDDFGLKDQEELKQLFRELNNKGCYVMLSNSDSEFIRELYSEYRQEKVTVARAINATASKRGKITELVVLNY